VHVSVAILARFSASLSRRVRVAAWLAAGRANAVRGVAGTRRHRIAALKPKRRQLVPSATATQGEADG